MLISFDESEFLKGLTKEQQKTFLENGKRITLQKKSILFSQGDSARKCYLIKTGSLKLSKLNEQGKEVIFRYLNRGEVAAVTAVLRDRNYPVTAECLEETEVIGWDKQTILTVMRQYPDIAINLIGIVFDRIEEVQDRYLELCTEAVDQRIARSLLRLMRSSGIKCSDGIHIDLSLSRQNIADYSGTTLYTVSRTLSNWEKKGWIKSGREKIFIKDPHSLVLFSEGLQ